MTVQNWNDSDFTAHIPQGKVVVKYYADWCGSCKLFAPKFKRLAADDRFKHITFVEIDAENNPEARKAAFVDNLPFLAVFENGQLVKGEATSKEDFLLNMLESLQ